MSELLSPLLLVWSLGWASALKVGLPFGALTGVESFDTGSAFGGSQTHINLPFSTFATPDLAALEKFQAKVGGRPGRGERTATERPLIQLQGSRGNTVHGGGGPASSGQPRGVINLPLAQFRLPFASVSETRQELPLFARAQQLREQRAESLRSAGPQPSAKPSRGSHINVGGSRDGNLASAAQTKSGVVSPLIPLANKLTLPYSIMNFPLSALDLPLEKVLLPFSNFNNLPLGSNVPLGAALPAAPLLRALDEPLREAKAAELSSDLASDLAADLSSRISAFEASLRNDEPVSTLLGEAAIALQQPNAINLNTLSLPYSFLNNPLSFFNLPLAYLNLPFGSTNLPFAHLNLPFGFFNLPLYELMQTFGVPTGLSRDAVPERPPSPLDAAAGLEEGEDRRFVPSEPTGRRLTGALEELAAAEAELSRFVGHYARANAHSPLPKPRQGLDIADALLGSAFGAAAEEPVEEEEEARRSVEERYAASLEAADMDPRSKEVFGKFSRVLRDALPSVPELGGLQGLPNSLFTTPFSLFNLPLGFLDLPTGFLNLPLSHFNLPLSHLTLPFASLALPVDDIATPELAQNVHNATVELADVPPSLLELLNPENPLQSYLNLPLSEMNLPLAVLDMPFAVFDMPFAFLNLPMGHLNTPLTHLHLPFEISSLPFAELGLPLESFISYPTT